MMDNTCPECSQPTALVEEQSTDGAPVRYRECGTCGPIFEYSGALKGLFSMPKLNRCWFVLEAAV